MAGVGIARVADCSVCLGTFKDPRVLPCGHTFCLICITEHGRSKDSDPFCPNCRTKFQIPSTGFDGLAKNYSLNSVLYEGADMVGASRVKVTKGSCKKHSGEELVRYCVQCSVVICLECMDEDHQRHEYSKINRFAKEARSQLEGYMKSIKPVLSQVTSQKTQLEEKSKKFCDLLDVTELAINEEYEKNKRFLDDHKRLLLEQLSNEKQKVAKELKMKTDEIETEHMRLASFNTRIEEMLQGTDEASMFDIVCQHKDFKESFEKLEQAQTQPMGQVNVKGIEFIPGDFKKFMSSRENMIGRLQMESHSGPKIERNKIMESANEQLKDLTNKKPASKDSVSCSIINSLDQYDMEKQMSAVECDGIKVIVNGDTTFAIEGEWINVVKAIEQLEELKNKKLANKNATEVNKELTSDTCAPEKPKERNRVLKKDLFPTIKQVDHSLSQQVPIDQHVWYYLKRKHRDELDSIAQQHLCVMKVVCDSSNEEITHSLEVVPYCRNDSNDAQKHVDDAVEEFAQLYQKVSEPGIVKESIKLPRALSQGMPQKLITEVEEMDVFFLRSDDPCLVGPQASVEEAKQKVSDFIGGHKDSQQQMQPDDYRGQAQASATDRVEPMKFKTRSGLTVYVSQGDLVRQSLDAIVNPANENLGNGGGAARAIAKAAGESLQWECKDFIRKYGKLGLALVMHTTAGKLQPRIKYVIHTVGPRKSEVKDDEELFQLVRLTILNCLCYANDVLNIHSIAIPAISSGIFGVPIEIVGRASYEALKMFDSHYASSKKKCLREIHFLNNDEATVSNMKRIFQSSMKDNCKSCVDPEHFDVNSCGKVFGTFNRNQPKGTMTTKENSRQHLAGYKDCGTIEIDYSFNDGVQGATHPNPGAPYRGTHRTAYLPANKEGHEVLRLLKRAFDAGLVFTIGRCNTTRRDNVIIWNDVSHKTSTTGQHGYPDPTYLKQVTEELAAKGIH